MRKSLRTNALAALTALAVLAGPAAARAQTPNPAAIQLFEEGRKLMGEGKYKEACPKLAESARMTPAVGTHLNLAKCYEALGKTASAWTNYKQAVFLGKKLNDDRVPLAEQKATELEPKLMKLQIKMASGDVPGLTIHQDDQDVGKGAIDTPIPADPGDHVIEATAPGFSVWSTHVTVGKEGQVVIVNIPALIPKPDAGGKPGGPSPLRPVAFAVGGVGVAGLVLGGVMGGLAMSAKNDLKTLCPSNKCTTQAAQDAHASANTKALVSTVGMAVGGAALVTGVVLFVVSRPSSSAKPDEPKSAQIIPSFGPDGGALNLIGHF